MRGAVFYVVAAAAICAANVCRADPSDWRFCIATDFKGRVAYVTDLFQSQGSAKDVGAVLQNILNQDRVAFQNVQCPYPRDEATIAHRQQVAKTFLKKLGFRTVRVK